MKNGMGPGTARFERRGNSLSLDFAVTDVWDAISSDRRIERMAKKSAAVYRGSPGNILI
jgi:hypothetical protein